MGAETPSAVGLMSKKSSAAAHVAGNNKKRNSKRRDFTAGLRLRGLDGGEGTTSEVQTKSHCSCCSVAQTGASITSIERPDCVWYHPPNARRAHEPRRDHGPLARLSPQSGSGPLPHRCRAPFS